MVKKWFAITACAVILIDQAAKLLIKKTGEYTLNTGAVFGLMQGTNYLLAAITLAFLAFITFYHKKLPKNRYANAAFALITGGLTANMIDRIFIGGVIDFIKIGWWPAFNIADSAATIGVIGLIAYYMKKK